MKVASREISHTKNQFYAGGARSRKFVQPGVIMSDKLTDDEFARMVAEEVKNKLSPIQKQTLLREENWPRWREALIALSENLQRQIENIEADAESDNERFSSMGREGSALSREAGTYYDAKATRVRRFKFHVDKKLDEILVMIETGTEMKTDGWDKVEFYRRAIAKHKTLMKDFDLEDTAIDRSLWASLNGEWLFDSIQDSNL